MTLPIISPVPSVGRLERVFDAEILWRVRDALLSTLTGQTPVFTRTGARTFHATDGTLLTVPHGFARWEMVDLDGSLANATPLAVLESGTTNLVLRSQDLGHAQWVADVGTPSLGTATITLGELVLQQATDNDGTLAERWRNTLGTAVYTGRAGVSWYMAASSPAASGTKVEVYDNTAAALRYDATVTFAGTTPSVSNSTGVTPGARFIGRVRDSAGTWRYVYRATGGTTTGFDASNVNYLRVTPAVTGSQQGDVFLGGFQVEPLASVTTYVPTTSATVTAPGDVFYIPCNVPPSRAPMTLFVRLHDLQLARYGSAMRLLSLGKGDATGARLSIVSDGTYWQAEHHNGTSSVTSALAALPAYGADLLLRLVLREDGSVYLGQQASGSVEATSVASGALALAAAWGNDSGTVKLSLAGSWAHANARVMGLALVLGEQPMTFGEGLLR